MLRCRVQNLVLHQAGADRTRRGHPATLPNPVTRSRHHVVLMQRGFVGASHSTSGRGTNHKRVALVGPSVHARRGKGPLNSAGRVRVCVCVYTVLASPAAAAAACGSCLPRSYGQTNGRMDSVCVYVRVVRVCVRVRACGWYSPVGEIDCPGIAPEPPKSMHWLA